MSRRPGIGQGWFEKFRDDLYPSDFITERGVKMSAPEYYDKQLELADPELARKVFAARRHGVNRFMDNNTDSRLRVREEVHKSRANLLKRGLDNE